MPSALTPATTLPLLHCHGKGREGVCERERGRERERKREGRVEEIGKEGEDGERKREMGGVGGVEW